MNWLTKMFSHKEKATPMDSTPKPRGDRRPMLDPCIVNVDTDDLGQYSNTLFKELSALHPVNPNLPEQFWKKGPIESVEEHKVVDRIIRKLQAESSLIRIHVTGIASTSVTAYRSELLSSVQDEGSHDHLVIQLNRKFRNGGVDLITHLVFRIAADKYKFAYTKL